MRGTKYFISAVAVVVGLSAPALAFSQSNAGNRSASKATDADEEESKNWSISGSVATRIGQGTFLGLEDDANTTSDQQPAGSAFDRVNIVYTLNPTYTVGEFTFGAEFQLVQWLTAGGGVFGIPTSGGANEASDIFFQDITLTGTWKGHTFDSIGLKVTPGVEVNLPTHKASRVNNKLFDVAGSVSATKPFFDNRLTLRGQMSGAKYFYRFKTSTVDPDEVGENNVLFRPGQAEDLGNGLIAIGGFNLSHSFSAGATANVKIVDRLSASVSYFFINFWSFGGPEADQFTAENAQPGKNNSQVVSTGVNLSYKANNWLSFRGGIGSYMPPKTSDNESFRFPFWNTQGGASNSSWVEFGVSAKY